MNFKFKYCVFSEIIFLLYFKPSGDFLIRNNFVKTILRKNIIWCKSKINLLGCSAYQGASRLFSDYVLPLEQFPFFPPLIVVLQKSKNFSRFFLEIDYFSKTIMSTLSYLTVHKPSLICHQKKLDSMGLVILTYIGNKQMCKANT